MAIQIEILQINPDVRAAFYYPVPVNRQLPGAVDPNRTPAGSRLSAAEIQALKDGELYEYLVTGARPASASVHQIQTTLVARYNDPHIQELAKNEYEKLYATVANAYNGSAWV